MGRTKQEWTEIKVSVVSYEWEVLLQALEEYQSRRRKKTGSKADNVIKDAELLTAQRVIARLVVAHSHGKVSLGHNPGV